MFKAPAGNCAVSLHPAGVANSGADGGESTPGGVALTVSRSSPQQATAPSVFTLQVWRSNPELTADELPCRRHGSGRKQVIAPAVFHVPSVFNPQGVFTTRQR